MFNLAWDYLRRGFEQRADAEAPYLLDCCFAAFLAADFSADFCFAALCLASSLSCFSVFASAT
jgi:hypothetical protein